MNQEPEAKPRSETSNPGSTTPVSSELKVKRFRFLRWATRIGLALLVLFLLSSIFVFVRVDIPNEMELFGHKLHTSFLAKLDGNGSVPANANPGKRPIIIGHRGSGLPHRDNNDVLIGNSESAIQKAINAKIQWIEIDVRITKDKKLVLFHDHSVADKTNSKVDSAVANLDWSDLKALELEASPPERILLLSEAIEKFDGPKVKWVVDIKKESESDLDEAKMKLLTPVLQQLGRERAILFGNTQVLELYRENEELSGFDYGLLMLKSEHFPTFLFSRDSMLPECVRLNAKYLVLPGIFAETSFIRKAIKYRDESNHKIEVLVWDCENGIDQKNVIARGAAGLIVDTPGETQKRFDNAD